MSNVGADGARERSWLMVFGPASDRKGMLLMMACHISHPEWQKTGKVF